MNVIKTIFPYIMSAITIYTMLSAGNQKKYTWLIGLANRALWLTWIISIQAWGLLPMTAALTFVYLRNHFKWNK